jgi:hypothetical protein
MTVSVQLQQQKSLVVSLKGLGPKMNWLPTTSHELTMPLALSADEFWPSVVSLKAVNKEAEESTEVVAFRKQRLAKRQQIEKT